MKRVLPVKKRYVNVRLRHVAPNSLPQSLSKNSEGIDRLSDILSSIGLLHDDEMHGLVDGINVLIASRSNARFVGIETIPTNQSLYVGSILDALGAGGYRLNITVGLPHCVINKCTIEPGIVVRLERKPGMPELPLIIHKNLYMVVCAIHADTKRPFKRGDPGVDVGGMLAGKVLMHVGDMVDGTFTVVFSSLKVMCNIANLGCNKVSIRVGLAIRQPRMGFLPVTNFNNETYLTDTNCAFLC